MSVKQKNTDSNYASLLLSIIEGQKDIVIFSLDNNYCYTVFNTRHKQTMKQIWGADIEVGMNMLDIIKDPRDRIKAKKNFDRVLKGESFTLIEEYGEHPNRFYYEDMYNPVFDDSGKVIGLSLFLRDITQKVKTEEELNKYRTRLEELVKKRTAELETTKKELERDIVKRKVIAQRERKISHRLSTLINHLPGGILVETHDRKVMQANYRFCEMFSIQEPPESLKGIDCREAAGELKAFFIDSDKFVTRIDEIVSSGKVVLKEELFLKDDRIFERDYIPVKMAEDKVEHLWHYRDVTSRIKTAESLRDINRLLETIFQHTQIMVAYMDPEFNFIRVNRAYAEADDRTPDFFPNKNHFQLYPNEENEAIFRKVLETGEPHLSFAKPFEYAEHPERGTTYWDWSLVPVKTGDGAVEGLLLSLSDVTERIKAQEAVIRSEERYRTLVEQASDGIFIIDSEGNYVEVNHAGCKILGYERNELVGKNLLDLLPPEDVKKRPLVYSSLKKGGDPVITERRLLKKDGSLIPVEISARMLPDGRLLGIIRDITDRKKTEEKIRRYQNHLEEMVKQRTEELESFAYSVSHDLRTPLRAIDSFTRILKDEYGNQLDQEGNRLLKIVTDNTQHMGQLIKDILILSRLGMRDMIWQQVNMQELVEEVRTRLSAQSKKDRKIIWKIGNLPPVRGDRSLLRQVIVNLLDNALKFTSPIEETVIEIGSSMNESDLVYFIRDNGVGFDERYVNKLFEVFQRQHNIKDFEGTGVGLAIVKRIISRHNGRIWAQGKVNRGATFYFCLPDQSQDTEED